MSDCACSPTLGRPCWNCYFLGIAMAVAARADCRRRQFGCVIVNKNRVVSTGYNGGPAGGPSCLAGECPRGLLTYEQSKGAHQGNHDYSDCISLHAETNAIAYANRTDTEGATAYINGPIGPWVVCDMCGKLLTAAGVTRVVTPPW